MRPKCRICKSSFKGSGQWKRIDPELLNQLSQRMREWFIRTQSNILLQIVQLLTTSWCSCLSYNPAVRSVQRKPVRQHERLNTNHLVKQLSKKEQITIVRIPSTAKFSSITHCLQPFVKRMSSIPNTHSPNRPRRGSQLVRVSCP